jgi:uncharacterized integral membrane protein
MRQLRWFVAVILLLGTLGVLAAFILANDREATVDLLFVSKLDAPTWLVVLASFGAGAFAASLGLSFQLTRKSLAVRRSERRVRSLESEIADLKSAAAEAPLPTPTDSPAAPAP